MVAKSTDESTEDEHLAHELRQYLKQSVIARHYDPFQHWKSLQNSFPTLYELAIRYISIISTSVPSERKFSEAGDIKSNERNRLTGPLSFTNGSLKSTTTNSNYLKKYMVRLVRK
ncbi:zinc finger BED domain-containing protein 4-like [Temnothorax curvispinosus]|nr:zinc finger BED domain-containing protein 4-like [Temnothorax curvispinosus]